MIGLPTALGWSYPVADSSLHDVVARTRVETDHDTQELFVRRLISRDVVLVPHVVLTEWVASLELVDESGGRQAGVDWRRRVLPL